MESNQTLLPQKEEKKLHIIKTLVVETFKGWIDDKASRIAAALAYYTIFAIAPLLIITISVVGFVFGESAAQNEIATQLEDMIGPEVASVVESAVASTNKPTSGIIATIIGFVTMLLGASGLFGEIQAALNTIWKAEPPEGGGIMLLVKNRLILFGMVFSIGFVLMLSLFAGIAVTAVTEYFDFGAFLQWLNLIISFGLVTLLFAIIYKVLPDVTPAWSDVWIGSAVTSLLFTIGKLLIGLYMGSSNIGSAYGAAGSLIVFLVWIYYSAQVFLLGAEFTYVYAHRYGSLAKTSK
ncbi:MAG: ribonuclease BN [Anaerolineaceae bacterium 4572_78]|nr:MAG: ribonuclease BN [Anaerolineaceae bacterium 4572_78]